MNERREAQSPPPPRGAGAGGGGLRRPSSNDADPRGDIPLSESAEREGSIGWGPSFGQKRQREFLKANVRAKRLRKDMTASEKALWQLLRQIPEAHFRKQFAIDHRVFDFAELSARLLIELDGAVHNDPDVARDDALKQKQAEAQGFRVLRLTNADVAERPDWVVEQVSLCLDAPHPLPPPRKGAGVD